MGNSLVDSTESHEQSKTDIEPISNQSITTLHAIISSTHPRMSKPRLNPLDHILRGGPLLSPLRPLAQTPKGPSVLKPTQSQSHVSKLIYQHL
ncbi:Uncharacterized protein HZ326_8212 [Fusarium oxysporum f. sp. albedinis]|nr:Uncharacterized protein HZ326_8212 [Fusarium oxysporum f. sp. albedinis]